MTVLIVDIVGVILLAIGITLVVKRPAGPAPAGEDGDPRVYMRRIAGTMMAAFGLALGLMVTLFHFAAIE